MQTQTIKKIESLSIERKTKFLLGIIKRNPKYTFSSLKLVLAKESKYFENIEKNLTVGLNGTILGEIQDKKVKSTEIIVDTFIDESKFMVREAFWKEGIIEEKLHFNLVFLCSDDSKPNQIALTHTVTHKKRNAILKVSVDKSIEYKKGKLYETTEDDFGLLIIKNTAENHAHQLELKNISFTLIDKYGVALNDREIVTMSGPSEISIHPNRKMKDFSLSINLSKLPHPIEEHEYVVVMNGEKKIANESYVPINPVEDFLPCTFKIVPNKKKTDLLFRVNEEDKTTCREISVPDISYDLHNTYEKNIANIKIENRSDVYDQNNKYYLEINDLSISKAVLPLDEEQNNEKFKEQLSEIIKVVYKAPNTKKWNEILQIKTPLIRLKNGKNSLINLKVKVDPRDFKKLDPELENKADVKIVVNFNYSIKDEDGRTKFGPKPKTYTIEFQLRQYEGDKWLAIDYGTSAIVAQYGSAVSNTLESKVKTQFKTLVNSGENTYVNDDYDERDEALLSSTISLRNNESLSGNFKDSIVSISPKLENLSSGEEYLLPYLKSLVGHEKFPQDFLDLIKVASLKSLRPIDVIKEAYTILLNDLVVPAYQGIRRNKIVLTIPNSFTTQHKKILRDIIKSNFKKIWEDYIVFVSESDAVAWYYIDHSFALLQKAANDEKVNLRKQTPLKDETILIYDMGAGTLDITLFRIQEKENGKKKINILGKIGQISGGNYADHVIGKEFWSQVDNTDEDTYNPMKMEHVEGFRSEKIKYRTFIRNILKPAISSFDQSKVTENRFYGDNCITPQAVDFEKVIQSDGYQEYLIKNTTTILTLLKSTFGLGSNIKIDTLVLSGRGVQLKGLNEMLQDAITKQFNNSQPITIQIPPENLKTIVSEGAIYYATRRKSNNIEFTPLSITARYGILKRLTGRRYEYEEILNSDSPSAELINFNDTYFEGNKVERALGTLSEVEEIVVIQTYLQKQKILEYLNDVESTREESLEKYYQSSSHITSFQSNRDFDLKKNMITIAIDTESEIYIQFNNNIKTKFIVPASDLENSEFFKKPMWYLF